MLQSFKMHLGLWPFELQVLKPRGGGMRSLSRGKSEREGEREATMHR